MAVKLTFQTNAKSTLKDLEKVDKKVKDIQKENAIKQGVASLNEKIKDTIGMTDFGASLAGFTSKLGGVTKLLNPWAAALTASIAAITYLNKMVNDRIQSGMGAANTRERSVATLQGQLTSQGVLSTTPIVYELERMAENGVASVEDLTRAFTKLVPVMRGNSKEALEWTARMADVQAATGLSAEQLTTAINQILTTGNIEEEVAKKIPFWAELSKAMNMSIDDVKKLVQAHKVGSKQMLEALKNATQMYAGTAAALSATTEGAKASMEAAKGLANEPAARGLNEMLRQYYGERQQYYDALQGNKEYRDAALKLGQAAGKIEVVMDKLGDVLETIGNSILIRLATFFEKNKEFFGFEPDKSETELGIQEISEARKRVGQAGFDIVYDTLDKTKGGLTSTEQALEDLRRYKEELNQEFYTLMNEMQKAEANETARTITEYAMRTSPLAHYVAHNFGFYDDIFGKGIPELDERLEQLTKAMVEANDTEKQLMQDISTLTDREIKLTEEKRKAEADAELERNKAKLSKESAELMQKLLLKEGTPEQIAKVMGYEEDGVWRSAEVDKIIEMYEESKKALMENAGAVLETEEQMYDVLMVIKQFKEIEPWAERLIELRKQEAEALEKQNKAEEERIRKEREATMEKLKEGDSLVRKYSESDAYNKAYERIDKLVKELAKSDLDYMSQQVILSKELHNMLKAEGAQKASRTHETISAGGLRSVKDFNYDSISIEERQLETAKEILRAAKDASEILGGLSAKLPSPTVAQ